MEEEDWNHMKTKTMTLAATLVGLGVTAAALADENGPEAVGGRTATELRWERANSSGPWPATIYFAQHRAPQQQSPQQSPNKR